MTGSEGQAGAELEAHLLGLLGTKDWPEGTFEDLALAVFRYQYRHNPHYRSYARNEGADPAVVTDWKRIPLVPTRAFKALRLYCGDPSDAMAVFRTSGTTGGQAARGTHYVRSLALYEASLLSGFQRWVLPDGVRPRMLSLVTAGTKAKDSSLGHMSDVVADRLCDEVGPVVLHETGLDIDATLEVLLRWSHSTTPVLLFSTALALASLLEGVGERGASLELPRGSRIMETGGFKGRRQQVTREALRLAVHRQLGVEAKGVVSEYGMTEMLSQFYDGAKVDPHAAPGVFHGPPWVRTRVLDPATLTPVPTGEVGVLAHFDLANLHSVSALLTEDLGRQAEDGFVLLGRAEGSDLRGCSLAFEELVRAQRGSHV